MWGEWVVVIYRGLFWEQRAAVSCLTLQSDLNFLGYAKTYLWQIASFFFTSSWIIYEVLQLVPTICLRFLNSVCVCVCETEMLKYDVLIIMALTDWSSWKLNCFLKCFLWHLYDTSEHWNTTYCNNTTAKRLKRCPTWCAGRFQCTSVGKWTVIWTQGLNVYLSNQKLTFSYSAKVQSPMWEMKLKDAEQSGGTESSEDFYSVIFPNTITPALWLHRFVKEV